MNQILDTNDDISTLVEGARQCAVNSIPGKPTCQPPRTIINEYTINMGQFEIDGSPSSS